MYFQKSMFLLFNPFFPMICSCVLTMFLFLNLNQTKVSILHYMRHADRRRHHTSPPNPVSATWCKRVTRTTSSVASTTNVNITPQNPPPSPVSATWCKRVTRTTSSVASTTNVNITPQNPTPNPVSATWCKRVTRTTSSVASTTNVNITPQNPPPKPC